MRIVLPDAAHRAASSFLQRIEVLAPGISWRSRHPDSRVGPQAPELLPRTVGVDLAAGPGADEPVEEKAGDEAKGPHQE